MLPAICESTWSSRLARRIVDAGFRAFAKRRVVTLERNSAAAAQERALQQVVRRHRRTQFGRDHGFDRIRSIADYQRQVPLRGYEDFWQEYWQPIFPKLQGATCADPVRYIALSSGTTSGTTKHIPVTASILKSNRKAALTALSWFQAVHHDAHLFHGPMFFLGGSTDLQPLVSANSIGRPVNRNRQVYAGDLSGIVAEEVPALLRPFTFPPRDLALLADWETKLEQLAERSSRLPISLVSGVPAWLLVLFERLLKLTGKQKIAEIWPSLELIVHGGTRFDPYRALFREIVGGDVKFLETYPASEGFIAAEDPRYGMLRLIPDHGVFFEFVPVAELNVPQPTRHTMASIEPGVQYAVVLTTAAGLWSYVLGDTVCFESRDPPLLRFTGRTKQFLSAFGEHLIGEEVEQAVARAAERTRTTVVDFHAGPLFPENVRSPGKHRFLAEFAGASACIPDFARELDRALIEINDDYRAHRQGDLTLLPPEVVPVPRGGFAAWMRAKGKLGGQHKVPRLDNTGQITQELSCRFSPLCVV